MLKILSWNIRQGGGTRINKITKALQNNDADILVLSEFRNNDSGLKIRYNLLRMGYRYQNVTAALKNDNAVASFSKLPCNQFLFPKADSNFSHNVLISEFEAFDLVGVYLPHKKKHKLFDFLIQQAQNEKPSIIVGDYNTGKNHIDQVGDSFWYTDKLEALENNGYIDAFRQLNGDIKEYSWFSHQGNLYRYDHTFIHKDLLPIVKSCYYLHPWREEGLSDHSPMILELG